MLNIVLYAGLLIQSLYIWEITKNDWFPISL